MISEYLRKNENSLLYKTFCLGLFIFGLSIFYSNASKNTKFASSEVLLDFPAYYIAGTSIAKGLSPYDKQNTERISNELQISYTEFRSFLYPPQSLLLFRELAKYPILESQRIFTLYKEILLFLTILLLSYSISYLPNQSGLQSNTSFNYIGFLGIALFLGSILWPFKNDFINGQINIIIFTSLCISFIVSEKYPIVSGFFLSIGILLKLSPILMLPYFLFRSRLSVIISTILFGILFTLVSIYQFGFYLHLYYLQNLIFGTVSGDTISNLGWPYSVVHNQSIKGFFHRIFVSDYLDPYFGTEVLINAPFIGKSISFCLVLSIIYLSIKVILPPINYLNRISFLTSLPGLNLKEDSNYLIFGFFLSGSLLISPLSWVHHKVLLLFPLLVCFYKILFTDLDWRRFTTYFLILILCVVLLSINHLYPYNKIPILGIIFSYIHLIGNLLIFLVTYNMLKNKL